MRDFTSDNHPLLLLAAGELLWDELSAGRVPGGAPANVAVNAAALGLRSVLVSRVGDDDSGRELVEAIAARGVDVICVQIDPALPTGRVGVQLDEDGRPTFEVHEGVAWDAVEATSRVLEVAAEADALCFGTLAQRTSRGREAVTRIVEAAGERALRLCDVNLRTPFIDAEVVRVSLGLANVARLNEEELAMIRAVDGLVGDETVVLGQLLETYGLDLIALSRGGHGSRLFARGEDSRHAGERAEVVDTVGAGDAFTAALIAGLLRGDGLDDLNTAANRVAAEACTSLGATHSPPKPSADPFNHKGG